MIELSEQFIPLSQAAKMLSLSINTVKAHVRRGNLEATKIGGVWRTTREAVARFLEKSQDETNTTTPAQGRQEADRAHEEAGEYLKSQGVG